MNSTRAIAGDGIGAGLASGPVPRATATTHPPLQSWLPSDKVVLTSYGRTGVYLALMTIGVRRREVMIPAFTCATALPPAILQSGGIPVFVDINEQTMDMDLGCLERKNSTSARVVISHHYYGSTASNVRGIQEFSRRNGLIHIEDCTHSLGAGCEGDGVGQIGDVAVYSFSKLLNCPGGGAVTFKDPALLERAREVQREYANPFHSFVTNTEACKYELELRDDRPGSTRIDAGVERSAWSGFARRLVVKTLCDGRFYRRGAFRAMAAGEVGMFRPGLDTRMTGLQESRITRMMGCMSAVVRERRRKARLLDRVMPSYFKDFEANVWMQYVTRHPKVEALALNLQAHGIRTRRVWPYTQKYWADQLTQSVRALRDELLLIDVDSVSDAALDVLCRGGGRMVSGI
jgi:dTDP-4-amino-4,6-dideoxygalactose transaminase